MRRQRMVTIFWLSVSITVLAGCAGCAWETSWSWAGVNVMDDINDHE